MRLELFRFELGMELAAQVPRVVADLADLDIGAVRRLAGDPQSGRGQDLLILAVEFVTMTVPLADLSASVRLVSEAAVLQKTGPGAQPHRATQFVDALQLAELVNDAVRRAGIELARIRSFEAAHVARVLDHHGLHAQADAEV